MTRRVRTRRKAAPGDSLRRRQPAQVRRAAVVPHSQPAARRGRRGAPRLVVPDPTRLSSATNEAPLSRAGSSLSRASVLVEDRAQARLQRYFRRDSTNSRDSASPLTARGGADDDPADPHERPGPGEAELLVQGALEGRGVRRQRGRAVLERRAARHRGRSCRAAGPPRPRRRRPGPTRRRRTPTRAGCAAGTRSRRRPRRRRARWRRPDAGTVTASATGAAQALGGVAGRGERYDAHQHRRARRARSRPGSVSSGERTTNWRAPSRGQRRSRPHRLVSRAVLSTCDAALGSATPDGSPTAKPDALAGQARPAAPRRGGWRRHRGGQCAAARRPPGGTGGRPRLGVDDRPGRQRWPGRGRWPASSWIHHGRGAGTATSVELPNPVQKGSPNGRGRPLASAGAEPTSSVARLGVVPRGDAQVA